MPMRRLTGLAATATAAAFGAVLGAAPVALASGGTVSAPIPKSAYERPADHLVVTVSHSGNPASDGRWELYCHPARGHHPSPKAACDGLDEVITWGKDPFAPVPSGTRCTLQYGGPATAHVSGVWAGRPVDAVFSRKNGCEMHRWDTLVPLLPRTPGAR